jgi:tetratricopeptide (TPR) repeat protein
MMSKCKEQKLQCANCGDYDIKLLKCARCVLVIYCSKECQKQHWTVHKSKCIPLHLRKPIEYKKTEQSIIKCVICLDNIYNETIILDCKHELHKLCLNEYKTYGNKTCPICRCDLSKFDKIFTIAFKLYQEKDPDYSVIIKLLEDNIENNHPKSQMLVAKIYFESDNSEDLDRAVLLCKSIKIKDHRIHILLGSIYEKQTYYLEAIEEYTKILEFDLNNKLVSKIYYSIGNIYNKLKN